MNDQSGLISALASVAGLMLVVAGTMLALNAVPKPETCPVPLYLEDGTLYGILRENCPGGGHKTR